MTNCTTQGGACLGNAGTPATLPPANQPFIGSNTGCAQTIYILYVVGFFTGISALIGVVIAHVSVDDANPMLRSHYQFQIRTFWIGFLNLVVGTLLCMIIIGIPILAWGLLWSLVRIIKGIVLLNEGRPIANPKSWMFG